MNIAQNKLQVGKAATIRVTVGVPPQRLISVGNMNDYIAMTEGGRISVVRTLKYVLTLKTIMSSLQTHPFFPSPLESISKSVAMVPDDFTPTFCLSVHPTIG